MLEERESYSDTRLLDNGSSGKNSEIDHELEDFLAEIETPEEDSSDNLAATNNSPENALCRSDNSIDKVKFVSRAPPVKDAAVHEEFATHRREKELTPVTAAPVMVFAEKENQTHVRLKAPEKTNIPANATDATITSKISGASWPTLPIELTSITQSSLSSSIVKLASDYRHRKHYHAIRGEFIRVSLALNQLALLAPVFRDQPRIPYAKKDRNESHRQLLIDQIVIDCHWLYCRREKIEPRWNELRSIFDANGIFDCSMISDRLAARNWSSAFRANDLLLLNNRQQMQLVQLRTDDRKEKHRQLLEGARTLGGAGEKNVRKAAEVTRIRLAINNWADQAHQIRGHEKMYESIWIARELLGRGASNKQIADLAALRCGCTPLNPRTVSGKIVRLDTVLAKA